MTRAREAMARMARILLSFCPVTVLCPPGELTDASLMLGRGIDILPMPLRTGRVRDTGPVFVRHGQTGALAGVDWMFNGWGGLAAGLEQDDGVAATLLDHLRLPRFRAPIICEGGAIQGDGAGCLLVTEEFLRHDRRDLGLTRQEVERLLMAYTGSTQLITLPRGLAGDPMVGHVSPVARFLAPGIVAIAAVPDDPDHPDHGSLSAAHKALSQAVDAQGIAPRVVSIPLPQTARRSDGAVSVRSYTDFVFVEGALIVPEYGDPQDREAGRILAAALPDREIVRASAHDLADVGGSLRAVTLAEPQAQAVAAVAA